MAKEPSKRAVFAAIGTNLAIATAKFIAAALTGSSAMVSEGIHSLVDTGNGLFLLVGMSQSRRPPDHEHPFGYGKDLYFWAFLVAILIFSIGGGMSIYEGISHLSRPRRLENPIVSLAVIAFSMAFEGITWWVAFRELSKSVAPDVSVLQIIRKSKDPSLFAVLYEDSAALMGLVIAAIGVSLTHWLETPVWDGLASIAIGLVLGTISILLAIECRSLLLGEAASSRLVSDICAVTESDPAVVNVQKVLTMHFGPHEILLAMDVEFRKQPVAEVVAAIERLEQKIRGRDADVKHLFIEARRIPSATGASRARAGRRGTDTVADESTRLT